MISPTCPVCNSIEYKVLGNPKLPKNNLQNFIRHNYKVVKCSSCNFYYVNPKIDLGVEEWSHFYNDEYFPTLNNWHFNTRTRDIKTRISKLDSFTASESKNFLDIGCGEGYTIFEANNREFKTFGIDISDNRIPDIKNPKITFYEGDLLKAKFPNSFFDIIYMDSVLEHLVDPVLYLLEINRVIKKDGAIYIGVPNEDSLFDKFRALVFKLVYRGKIASEIKPFLPPFHVSGFNKKSLKLIIEKTGFDLIVMNNFATRFEFRKYAPNTIGFWIHLGTLPLELLAILLKKEKYLEVYLQKK
jgi:SAM-dependent methyltransferase